MAKPKQPSQQFPFVEPDAGSGVRYATVASPVGLLTLFGDGEVLTHLSMESHEATKPDIHPDWIPDNGAFEDAQRQLTEYFDGTRSEFTIPLAPTGTPFRMSVWAALVRIPYGQTATYGEIAAEIGNPSASRAVGMANHFNPIAIMIPCHRVIGANGSLTGYGGGLDRKTLLLKLERSEPDSE